MLIFSSCWTVLNLEPHMYLKSWAPWSLITTRVTVSSQSADIGLREWIDALHSLIVICRSTYLRSKKVLIFKKLKALPIYPYIYGHSTTAWSPLMLLEAKQGPAWLVLGCQAHLSFHHLRNGWLPKSTFYFLRPDFLITTKGDRWSFHVPHTYHQSLLAAMFPGCSW